MHISVFEKRLKSFDRSLSVRPVIRAGRREWQILQEIDREVTRKGIISYEKGNVHVCVFPVLTDRVFEILNRCRTTRFRNGEELAKEFKLPTA